MADLRPDIDVALGAFGLAITVTVPGGTPIATTGIWLDSLVEPQPFGTDFRRRDPRRVMAVARDGSLDHLPRGTFISAPERDGDLVKTWTVDGLERVEVDNVRVILVSA